MGSKGTRKTGGGGGGGAGTLFDTSTILTTAILRSAATTLFPEINNASTTLRYRASTHGYTAAAFHARCNGVSPIFFVIKANTGYIATAYSVVSFNSVTNYVSAPSGTNFLNNLWNGTSTSTSKFYNSVYAGQYSLYDHPNYGPTFGGGHDLYIPDNCNVNTGYTAPFSYTVPTNTTLFGIYSSWTVSDMEVYS